MIASVAAVARGAADLPHAARVSASSPTADTTSHSTGGAPKDIAAAAVKAAESSAKGTGEHAGRQPAPDPQDVAATSRYVAELMAARLVGGSAPQGRPAHIAPERMAQLISFLEENAAPAEPASDEKAGVDVRS